MTELRWKLFEVAAWVAFLLCPDKHALGLVMKHGTIISRASLDEVKRQREASK